MSMSTHIYESSLSMQSMPTQAWLLEAIIVAMEVYLQEAEATVVTVAIIIIVTFIIIITYVGLNMLLVQLRLARNTQTNTNTNAIIKKCQVMSNGLRLAGSGGSQVLRASVLDQQLDRKVI